MAETRNARLITKRTSVPGKIPTGTTGDESSFIRAGELASNLSDHSLWGYDGANVFEYGSSSFLGLTGGTVSGNVFVSGGLSATTLSGGTIYSGGTNLYDIFLTSGDLSGTSVSAGSNIIVQQTGNDYRVSVSGSPIFNQLTTSGLTTINSNFIVTGNTNLEATSASTVYVEDYIQFNTGYTPGVTFEGRMYWDEPNGTVSLGMHGSQVLQQIGLEYYYYVKNQSGATIENGKVVRADGTLGASSRILGKYMIADGTIPAKFTLGVATEDIINGDDGYVTEFGLVRGIDTTGTPYGETWSNGDVLWVSPTFEGGLTNIEPQFPNIKVEMAIVVYANASNGSIFVRPHRYPSTNEIQDIISSGKTNNSILQYNASLSAYTNTTTPTLTSVSATTISGGTIYSGNTNLDTIIRSIASGTTGQDTYVTGATITGNTTLVLSRNDGQNVTTDLSIQRSITRNGEAFVTDTATRITLTPITISALRFAGTGPIDTGGIGFVVPDDYKNGGAFSYIWRSSTTSTTLSAKTLWTVYTGNTSNTGSLITAAESFQILDTPESTANVFIFSPSATLSATTLSAGMKVHCTISRDPADVQDTLASDLDMTDFIFTYNALR